MNRSGWLLLVEDNEDDVLLMRRALAKQGYEDEVVVARDGAEALEVLASSSGDLEGRRPELPGLVLLDINLPKVNGLEVLTRIREDDRTKLLRVVMFSTSGHETDVRRSYEIGANSYVRKPVNSNGFQEIVNSIGKYWLELNQNPLRITGALG